MDVAVGILSVGVLEPEITLEVFYPAALAYWVCKNRLAIRRLIDHNCYLWWKKPLQLLLGIFVTVCGKISSATRLLTCGTHYLNLLYLHHQLTVSKIDLKTTASH